MLCIMIRADCPYCAEAKKNLKKILEETPALKEIPICWTEESDEERDHYYIPAYFWDKEKLGEGEYREEEVRELLERAYVLDRERRKEAGS